MNTRNYYDDEHRIVVTGMGIAAPTGENLSEYFEALVSGHSGITHWKRMMDERLYSKVGGDMSDFDLNAYFARNGNIYSEEIVQHAKKLLRATPLSGRLGTIAAMQAFVDAGLAQVDINPRRFGHVLSGHNLNAYYIFENTLTLLEEPDFIDPLYGFMIFDTDVLSVISELLNVQGSSFTIGNACASGNMALLAGLDLIRSGRADVVLVTGGVMEVDPVMLQGFALIDAVSYRSFNDEPARASRPFDARREGFVPSQGTGAVILETLASAKKRGTHIHAELLGGASLSDASRLTRPDLAGQVETMRSALADARVNPEEVDYINAHATSTRLGDAVEVLAIKTVFGADAYRIPINSTKSMIGHCLTAAGMVEFVATTLQMENNVVHPTINQEENDPELDLDFVPNEARQHPIKVALSNSFGFGGLNACIVVRVV